MSKSVEVVIGASFSSSFRSVIGRAKSELDGLGKSLRRLTGRGAGGAGGDLGSSFKNMGRDVRAGASEIGRAERQLAAYTRQANAAARAQNALTRAERQRLSALNLVERQQTNINNRQQQYSRLFGIAAAAAVVAQPVRSAINFESGQADIRKVLDFGTNDKGQQKKILGDIGQGLMGLTRENPGSIADMQAIASGGAAMGVKPQEIVDYTRLVGKLALAWEIDPGEAGEKIGKLGQVMGLTTKQTSLLGDAMNTLENSGTAKAREILTIASTIGGTAKDAGFSGQQISAYGSTLIEKGAEPERASTALLDMITTLQTAKNLPKRQQDGLRDIGISPGKLQSAMAKDGPKATMKVLETLAKLSPEKRATAMSNIFGNSLQTANIAKLVTGLDLLKERLGQVANEQDYAGSAQKEYETRLDTTATKLGLAWNGLKEVSTTLGTNMLPTVGALADKFSNLLHTVNEFIVANPKLASSAFTAVAGLLAIGAAATIGRIGFSFLRGGAMAIEGILGRLSGGLLTRTATGLEAAGAAAGNSGKGFGRFPLGRVIAIGAAVAVLYSAFSDVRSISDFETAVGNLDAIDWITIGGGVLSLAGPVLKLAGAFANLAGSYALVGGLAGLAGMATFAAGAAFITAKMFLATKPADPSLIDPGRAPEKANDYRQRMQDGNDPEIARMRIFGKVDSGMPKLETGVKPEPFSFGQMWKDLMAPMPKAGGTVGAAGGGDAAAAANGTTQAVQQLNGTVAGLNKPNITNTTTVNAPISITGVMNPVAAGQTAASHINAQIAASKAGRAERELQYD